MSTTFIASSLHGLLWVSAMSRHESASRQEEKRARRVKRLPAQCHDGTHHFPFLLASVLEAHSIVHRTKGCLHRRRRGKGLTHRENHSTSHSTIGPSLGPIIPITLLMDVTGWWKRDGFVRAVMCSLTSAGQTSHATINTSPHFIRFVRSKSE